MPKSQVAFPHRVNARCIGFSGEGVGNCCGERATQLSIEIHFKCDFRYELEPLYPANPSIKHVVHRQTRLSWGMITQSNRILQTVGLGTDMKVNYSQSDPNRNVLTDLMYRSSSLVLVHQDSC